MARGSVVVFALFASLAACTLAVDWDAFSVGADQARAASDGAPGTAEAATGDDGGVLEAGADAPDAPSGSACESDAGCEVIAEGQEAVTYLAPIRKSTLLWIRRGAEGGVRRLGLDGGAPGIEVVSTSTTVAECAGTDIVYIRSDDGSIYRVLPTGSTCPIGVISRLRIIGSDLLTVSTAGIRRGSCGVDAGVIVDPSVASALWVDTIEPNRIFFAANGAIQTCLATAECVPNTIAPVPTAPEVVAIASDATRVYWATESSVSFGSRTTSTPTTIEAQSPRALVAARGSAWWTNFGQGTIMELRPGETAPSVVVSGLDHPWGLLVTDTELYVGEAGRGRILRYRR